MAQRTVHPGRVSVHPSNHGTTQVAERWSSSLDQAVDIKSARTHKVLYLRATKSLALNVRGASASAMQPMSIRTSLALVALCSVIGATPAASQSGGGFDLGWHTIDGGGGTGGTYSLGGTIGQPDAGGLTGGSFAHCPAP